MKGIFSALLALCMVVQGSAQPNEMKEEKLIGKWLITSIQIDGQMKDVTDRLYEIEFNADGKMTSKVCNRMWGNYTTTGDSLSFGPIMSTKMMCDEIGYETALGKVFMEANGFEHEGDKIILVKGNKKLMVLSGLP